MDPQITWDSLLEEWAKRNWQDVIELAEALLNWLDRGGFPPKTSNSAELGGQWHATVAKAAATYALKRSQEVLDDPDGIPASVSCSLSCASCNAEGPDKYDEAKHNGWTRIEYLPASTSENFLGVCPECSRR